MSSITELPSGRQSFLNFPAQRDLAALQADFAVLGVPYGRPYSHDDCPNDQAKAPDAIRSFPSDLDVQYTLEHFDFDLAGPLLAGQNVRVVDCGNVRHDPAEPGLHYRLAEQAARQIFMSGAVLLVLGGDHGIPIPILRALQVFAEPVTLVHIDAHLDWRDEIDGEAEGYSSPIRRASEMPWIKHIVQIGMRGIGSAREEEVRAAKAYGCDIIDAYEMHDIGIPAVLERIPTGGPYYLTIDADGIDPTIMPAVMAQTPGGLNWPQLRSLIHGLVAKGRVLGMDFVEMAPTHDVGGISLIHAERLLCNFIGASIRHGHRQQPLNG